MTPYYADGPDRTEETNDARVSLEAQLSEAMSVLESIADALERRPVSDFMASIPLVRRVMDLVATQPTA